MPAYPTGRVVDPTGAGDTFAGAMMGYLSASPSLDHAALKRAMAYGTVVASLTVEDGSLRRLQQSTTEQIEQRYQEYRAMLQVP